VRILVVVFLVLLAAASVAASAFTLAENILPSLAARRRQMLKLMIMHPQRAIAIHAPRPRRFALVLGLYGSSPRRHLGAVRTYDIRTYHTDREKEACFVEATPFDWPRVRLF